MIPLMLLIILVVSFSCSSYDGFGGRKWDPETGRNRRHSHLKVSRFLKKPCNGFLRVYAKVENGFQYASEYLILAHCIICSYV